MKLLTRNKASFVVIIAIISMLAVYIASRSETFTCRYYYNVNPVYNTFEYSIDYCEKIVTVMLPPLFLSPFLLVMYWMNNEVFRSWIKFTAWYVPLWMVGWLFYPGAGNNIMASSADGLLLFLVASIYVITSTVKIVRAYRRIKGAPSA